MSTGYGRGRSFFISGLILIAFMTVLGRLYWLQIYRHGFFADKARAQHFFFQKIPPRRGKIFDRNGKDLAIDVPAHSVYAVPPEINGLEAAANWLSPVLGLDSHFVQKRLSRKKKFVWLKRKVDSGVARLVQEEEIPGVHLLEETRRVNPGGMLFCHILGFVNIDNVGLEGVELLFNSELSGKAGKRKSERDASGREIPFLRSEMIPISHGVSLVLTVDIAIQYIAERELAKAVKKWDAESGSVIILDPSSGEILALANVPSFDLNYPAEVPVSYRRNRAVTDSFEPGSIFKPIVAAIAIRDGIVNLEDRFFCENGAFRYGGHILHDSHPHKILSVRQIIEQSSNIGIAKIAMKMGAVNLSKSLREFGFGKKTGIALPGEAKGFFRPVEKWSRLSLLSLPMGQEIAVTTLQVTMAYAAMANGGVLYRPQIVKRIVDEYGKILWESSPDPIRRVLPEEVARKITSVMEDVVGSNGTGWQAQMEEYHVAGKTGTAQKAAPEGGYSRTSFVSSFIGYVPSRRPELVISVVLDEPKSQHYGGTVAAPAFKNIAAGVLRYLGIPPEMESEETGQKKT